MVGRLIIYLITLPILALRAQVAVSGAVIAACESWDQNGVRKEVYQCPPSGNKMYQVYFYKNGVKYICNCYCNTTRNECSPASNTSAGAVNPSRSSNQQNAQFAVSLLSALIQISINQAEADKQKKEQARQAFEQQKQIDEQNRIIAFNKWKKEQSETQMKRSIEMAQKIKTGESLLEQMKTTGSSGKLEAFSTSSPGLEYQSLNNAPKSNIVTGAFEQLACAAYFSDLSAKATKPEEAAFYASEAEKVMQGQPTYYQCRLPKDNKSEIGQKMDKAKIIYNNFNLKIKDLEGVETKTEEVRQKKDEAVKNTEKAEKDLEELKKEHVSAPPEKKQEMDDLVAKAQDELNKAKEQLKEAEKSEKELDEERKKLEEELNQLKNEMQELKK